MVYHERGLLSTPSHMPHVSALMLPLQDSISKGAKSNVSPALPLLTPAAPVAACLCCLMGFTCVQENISTGHAQEGLTCTMREAC
jgi:hypothetical protein